MIGADLAFSLAWFLAYGLCRWASTRRRRRQHGYAPSQGAPPDRQATSWSAISFGRCLRKTVEAVVQARERGVTTVGLTDSDTTPIARHCDTYLLASIASSNFTGSYVASMAMLNAVLVACAQIKPKRSLVLLRQSEKEYLSGPRWYETAPQGGEGAPAAGRAARAGRRPARGRGDA